MLVSLQEFVLTGCFGPVLPDSTYWKLEALFGSPEAIGGQTRKQKWPSIWKYGDLQFYFRQKDLGLRMIHLDTFSGVDREPVGWRGLKIEPWCIRHQLPLEEFVSIAGSGLIEHESNYERVLVKYPSGVTVGFCPTDGLFGLWREWSMDDQVVNDYR